jgi:hypothetical protein
MTPQGTLMNVAHRIKSLIVASLLIAMCASNHLAGAPKALASGIAGMSILGMAASTTHR